MSSSRPAFYAAGGGRWREWWTLLHPPYTAWHLSYVALGALHTDMGFALSWGGFPALVGYVAQAPPARMLPTLGAVAVTAAAVAASWAQRRLSTPARELRRRTRSISGTLTLNSGAEIALDMPALLAPLEAVLRSLSWAFPLIAIGAVLARLA